jgi:hypothetical protein
MKIPKLRITLALAALTAPAFANDSTGYVGVGGLTYKKTAQIEMSSEHLSISKSKIRVEYEFTNLTDHDVSETILFPLPVLEPMIEGDAPDTTSTVESFKVWVNGQAVKTQTTSSGFLQGENITAQLQKCGFNAKEIGYAYYDSPYDSGGEPPEKLKTCMQHISDASGLKLHEETMLWDSQVTYSWPQTFPAQTTIKVVHEYVPLIGGGVSLALEEPEVRKNYCIDNTFMRKLNAQHATGATFHALGYVLKTGANWAKPIPKFKLTIDKDPNELLSLCWDSSLKKISPTRFEAVKTNFTPTHDLDIIFATPYETE